MTVQSIDTGTPSFVTFYFWNIGNTDASNVVIQTQDTLFSPPENMESSGFDPAVELQKFRANPQRHFDEMQAQEAKTEAMLRSTGDNKTADTIHAATEKRKSLLAPRKIVPKISRGTVIGEKMNIQAVANLETLRHVIFILIDWDDVLPTHTHHTNDLCYFVEAGKASPCVSPEK